MPTEWITAAEAARRLGIKQASLYSYVSRGVLSQAQGRRLAGQPVQRARGGGPGQARPAAPRPGPTELVIETQVTEITGDQLRYRGYDAIELAGERDFEEVAGLLWTALSARPAQPEPDGAEPGQRLAGHRRGGRGGQRSAGRAARRNACRSSGCR